ncbi:hypothetical protein R5R35_001186 [Gryllus longicercus]|uniref:VWFA domain-containing protein n=1 Tax=Gryllus longicercus TaxID=2509291 RepID=A0AAN9V1D4_9ORTH
MGSRSPKEAIIFVLDIGASASEHVYEDGNSCLHNAKKCIERIIERKIFASAGDEIGLVLLGTEMTANALQYPNISEGFRIANPSWEMMKIVQEIKGTAVDKCDWIDALVVAMDIMQTQTEGKKITAKKIVLFVDPDNDVNEDKLKTIINGIQKLEIELTAIGVDLFPEDEDGEGEKMDHEDIIDNNGKCSEISDLSGLSRRQRGEELMRRIINACEGISCNFVDAFSQLKTYQMKAVRPTPWNVTLDIGEKIKIPVALYKKIAPVALPPWQKTVRETTERKIGDAPTSESQNETPSNVRIEQDRVYMREDRTVVEKEDRIAGYFFGSTAVPFNECDEEQMRYKSGEKCLNILGFVRCTDIPRRYFIGDGCYYLVPQKKFPAAQQVLSAFIKALKDQEKVAIATKVYRKDTSPNLVALFPLLKKKYKCILVVELPFSEDVNEFVFPRVVPEKEEPDAEQLAAVDGLIDAMDLTKIPIEDGSTETFRVKETTDAGLMYHFRCVAHRAMHPNDPLPEDFPDIKAMLSCPFQSNANYKLALEVVKDKCKLVEQPEMTSLKKEDQHKRRKKSSDKDDSNPQPSTSRDGVNAFISDTNEEISIVKNTLVEVGTVKPHEDFTALVTRGENFKTVCDQMEKVILKLVLNSFGSESFPKALVALTTLRKSCVQKDPGIYNAWLPEFKTALNDRDRLNFWELVAKDGLGLINSEESPMSAISQEDALAIFKDSKEVGGANEEQELDVDDLIDEM